MASIGRQNSGLRRWHFDFSRHEKKQSSAADSVSDSPLGMDAVALPSIEETSRDSNIVALMAKRSWDIALAPLKQLPMNAFVMWMSGNQINIFPIMMTVMMGYNSLRSLFMMKKNTEKIEGPQAPLQKIVYCIGNCLLMALAINKFNSMGLLPTYASDWLGYNENAKRLQYLLADT